MSLLHTINKSPFSHNTLASCLNVCGNHDSILLIEDGVYAAMDGHSYVKTMEEKHQEGVQLLALISDVSARGLQDKIMKHITLIDYDGFVQLSITHRCVQSWY